MNDRQQLLLFQARPDHWRSFFKMLPISSANFVSDWPRSLYLLQ
jgi:hypothetical protein